MKKFYSLFAAVILAASVNAQTTVNFVFSAQGYANSTVLTEGTIDTNLNFTIAQNDGSNPPAYYTSGTNVRFYYDSSGNGNGGGMTIVPLNGAKITSLVINGVSNYTPTVKYSVDGGAKQTATLAGNIYTIAGLNAETSLMFQNANVTSQQLRITSIAVTYELNTMAVGDVNATKVNLVKNTVVGNTILFAAKADVQILNMNGQVVKTASVNENTSLDVATLAKGMYVVTANVNGKAVSQKIIKK